MQARSSLILAAALVAGLVVALVLTLDRGETPQGTPGGTKGSNSKSVERDSRSSPGPVHEAETPPTQDGRRSGVVIADPSTADGRLVEVELVRADSGEPVPDASVSWWARRDNIGGDASFEEWLRHCALEQHADSAVQLRSDFQGRVRVPDSERGFFVAASFADVWGCASFDAQREQSAKLVLAPDANLRVRVVDQGGAPVLDAPVALRQLTATSHFDWMVARTSATDGIAVLRHAGYVVRTRVDASSNLCVALQGLLEPVVEQPIDHDFAQETLLQLVLEANGSCEVAVVDEHDQPVRGAFEARLRFAEDQGGGVRPGNVPPAEVINSRTGSAVVFEHVELGRELAVEVIREGAGAPLEARGAGPRKPGERVRLRAHLGHDVVLLRGRLVDGLRKPLADVALRARLETRDAVRWFDTTWSLQTASDGTFSVDTQAAPDASDELVLAVHRVSESGAELAVARRVLPLELSAGTHDLGDFVLVDLGVVAAGQVVGADGEGIAGAVVTPSYSISAADFEQPMQWRECAPNAVRSDAKGRFEIRGEPEPKLISLIAQKEGLVAHPVVIESGRRDAKLVLVAAGAIEGTVLVDASLAAAIQVHATRDDDAAAPGVAPHVQPSTIDRDGKFALRALAPGTYSLVVVHGGTGVSLASIDGIAVRSGESTRDARLQPLDLRATHRMLDLELVDERGEVVRNARVFSRLSDVAGARWTSARREAGKVQLLSDGRPLDVAIAANGFLRTQLERITSSTRVTLRRAANLRFVLARGSRVPDPPLKLGVELTSLDAGAFTGSADTTSSFFDQRGELSCKSAILGEVHVALVLSLRDAGVAANTYVEDDVARIIDVADQPGEQVFELSVDAAKLDAAARALRGDR